MQNFSLYSNEFLTSSKIESHASAMLAKKSMILKKPYLDDFIVCRHFIMFSITINKIMKFVLISNYSKIEVGVTIRKLKNTDNSQKMEISSRQNITITPSEKLTLITFSTIQIIIINTLFLNYGSQITGILNFLVETC